MPHRFRDTGESIYTFGDTFLVRCPRCERRAEVALLPVPMSASPVQAMVLPPGRYRGRPTERSAEVVELPPTLTPSSRGSRLLAPRRCVCGHCGYVGEWRGKKLSIGDAAEDWYFGYPLWLQTPCCGQTLWAYNEPHLRFLEEFVAADLRERTPELRNSTSLTYAARLPRWMQLAANRDEVSRGLARLRAMLD